MEIKEGQNEITMPTALWEKLNEISGHIGELDAKVDACTSGIDRAADYQARQDQKMADTLMEIGKVKEIATSSATSVASTAAAAASAASAAATAAAEISALKLASATASATAKGERQGISLAWGVAVAVFGLIVSNGMMLYHIMTSK